MKKFPFFVTVLISAYLSGAENHLCTITKNFQQINDPQWEHYSTTQEMWGKLGHNPDITLSEDPHNKNLTNLNTLTLFVHGFGDSKNSKRTFRRCRDSNTLPGKVASFNFPDASLWIKNTIPYYMPLSQSSFAGRKDITTLLAVFKALCHASALPDVIYAHSRGAGTVIAAIGILSDPTPDETTYLGEWKITNQMRESILNKIKITYILNPLARFDAALHQQTQTFLNRLFIGYLLSDNVTGSIAQKVKAILPYATSYDPTTYKDPLEYIKQWKNVNAAIWVHFVKNDEAVGNKTDENVIQAFVALNNDKVLSDQKELYFSLADEGHNNYEPFINSIIQYVNYTRSCAHIQQAFDDLNNDARTKADTTQCNTDSSTEPICVSKRLKQCSDKYSQPKKNIFARTKDFILFHMPALLPATLLLTPYIMALSAWVYAKRNTAC